MAQLNTFVLEAQGRQYGVGMELTARGVGDPKSGAVLRAAMAITAFGPGGDAPDDVDDEATLTLLPQRSMTFQDSEVEIHDRLGALETAVDDAVDLDLPPELAKMLCNIVFRTHLDVFCRALLGDPPARVDPMTVRLQPGARAVRAKPRAPPSAKTAWLHEHLASLETAGMVFRNQQAIYEIVAMAIPKGSNSYRTVTDYRAVKDTIKWVVAPMPRLEEKASLFAGATAWCTLDMLQGCWQVPLSEDDQEVFAMVTPEGLFTPRRVPLGVVSAT